MTIRSDFLETAAVANEKRKDAAALYWKTQNRKRFKVSSFCFVVSFEGDRCRVFILWQGRRFLMRFSLSALVRPASLKKKALKLKASWPAAFLLDWIAH